jgi:hypothetical protein
MKHHPEWINRLVDLLMNKKLSIEIVESLAFILSYALHHHVHDLNEDQLATIIALLNSNDLN